ncbi:MAG TPA: HAD-IA family hydrolase [Roseiflexaceae bacterium]|nr:HAD-IA family hydrolase [Roseiflexaceae bacterium]
MSELQAVIFDRDHTLLYFDRAAVAGLEARVAEVAPELPHGAAVAHWAAWPGPWPRSPAEEPAFWRAFWRALAERHGAPWRAVGLEAIGAFYHTCFLAYPDAQRCLLAVRERGLRTAVLTNFELPSIDRTLAHAGLDPAAFDALLSSAALGVRKPDQAAFRAAAAALGVPPTACLLVDDLPANVAGARAAGMRAVLLDRAGLHPGEPERIAGLDELRDLL